MADSVMKKMLVITPTPTHPTNAGNRQHILALGNFFMSRGYLVDFLYLAYEPFDEQAMGEWINGRMIVVPRERLYMHAKTAAYLRKKLESVLMRTYRKLLLLTGSINKNQSCYNSEVDSHFPVFAQGIIKTLAAKAYDVVVCEYASMSKALNFFDDKVFKILDTHDIFTNRFRVYIENDLAPEWVSLYKDQERKALNRADLVLAVQEKDKQYFESLATGINVTIFNAIPPVKRRLEKKFEFKLLYLASGNKINTATISNFITKIFPAILSAFPETQLLIGGSICEGLAVTNEKAILTGSHESVSSFYAMGDVVINPEITGTGYKVKTMEALACGMPIISTIAGAVGSLEPFQQHLFIAKNVDCFGEKVIEVFSNPERLGKVSENALDWVKEHRSRMEKGLIEKLP